MNQIIDFFAESVCEPSEAAHRHSRCEILPLDIASRNMKGARVAHDWFGNGSSNLCGAVRVLRFGGSTVQFNQHRVVNIQSEHVINSVQVRSESVSCQLHAIRQPQ